MSACKDLPEAVEDICVEKYWAQGMSQAWWGGSKWPLLEFLCKMDLCSGKWKVSEVKNRTWRKYNMGSSVSGKGTDS